MAVIKVTPDGSSHKKSAKARGTGIFKQSGRVSTVDCVVRLVQGLCNMKSVGSRES